MASGTPWGWIAGAVGVVGLIWFSKKGSSPRSPRSATTSGSADEKVTGIPFGSGLGLRKANSYAEFVQSWNFGTATDWQNGLIVTANGAPVPFSIQVPSPATEHIRSTLQASWAQRRNSLPADATAGWDRYSKESYQVPNWIMGNPGAAVTAFPVDEFGRIKQGKYGDGGGLWQATFGGLLQNPLFQAVVVTALVFGGGPAGVAALGAYAMWKNRGQELTLKNAAMLAARTYAVSQCGEACGVAFDFGAGVAAGKSVDVAAEDALYKAMSPEQRAYFDQGKKLVAIAKPNTVGVHGQLPGSRVVWIKAA